MGSRHPVRAITGPAALLGSCLVLGACATPAGPRTAATDGVASTSRGDPADATPERRAAGAGALREGQGPEVRREPDGREPGALPADGARAFPELALDARQLQAEYDIPIDVNGAVVRYVRFYQSPEMRPHVARWLSRLQRYGPRYREILRAHGLPEDTVYLAMVESGFARRATSRARAVGPWQFLAATGRQYGLRQDRWVDERRDPEKAAVAAARFLRALHRQNGDWRLAWAAYNAGPSRVRRARALGHAGFWEMASAGVLPAETRAYVPKIMAAAILAKHAAAFGFAAHEIAPQRWVDYREVVVPRATELSTLARAAEVDVATLLDLNTELRRTRTPPRPYRLKIPREKAQAFAVNWPRLAGAAAKGAIARHRVKRGETLFAIARRYGVRPSELAAVNRVTPRRLRAGAVLVVPLGAAGGGSGAVAARTVPSHGTVRVVRGDTLWSIARRFGVTVQDLARWNEIRDPVRHVLRAGRVLAVVAGASLLARDR